MTPTWLVVLSLIATVVTGLTSLAVFLKVSFMAGELNNKVQQHTKEIDAVKTDVKEMRESPVWASHVTTH